MADSKQKPLQQPFWKVGEPMVWVAGGALALTLMIALILIAVIIKNGLGVFWPANLMRVTLNNGERLIGELVQTGEHPATLEKRLQLKIGNRDLYGLDFRWIEEKNIAQIDYPKELIGLERYEYGNFYGYLQKVASPDATFSQETEPWKAFEITQAEVHKKLEALELIEKEIVHLSNQLQRIRLQESKLRYEKMPSEHQEFQKLKQEKAKLNQSLQAVTSQQEKQIKALQAYTATFADATGQSKEIPLMLIVRAYQPNAMSFLEKIGFYWSKIGELLLGEPREANTEGGLFPAIFGTILMVFIMSIFSFPLGVIAAIYLREYAKEGLIVRLVRIAVNNLAGIPSIVYGVFGLGFFVYGIGHSIDQVFFPERLPTPTFGTGGVLWASLTLALLTLPVVIVATEEALGSVPIALREGALALGSTQLQTIVRVVLPMASPGIMTGFILSMARAAGEVAPLMITGVVKLAPSLPLDSTFPYVHLERKFMHLGFHIYDVGFQSPNVEAAKPMVFVTTFLLVFIVLVMSSVAIYLRNKMRKRYALKSF